MVNKNLIRKILHESTGNPIPFPKTKLVSNVSFKPFEAKDGAEVFFDGIIAGEGYAIPKESLFVIMMFQSNKQGKGYAKQFLKELKKLYKTVEAHGVDESSIKFWDAMQKQGLINDITDDGGSSISIEDFENDDGYD